MKAKYLLFTPILLGFLYLMLISNAGGPASSGNGNRTGSPGSSGTCSSCHSGGSFGTSITATVTDLAGNPVTAYIPGDTLFVEYQVSSTSGTPKYGFQSIMLTGSNANAGNFHSTQTTNTQITTLSGKKLPEHSAKSTTGNFKVKWTAPATGTGTVTLYYIGMAVNSNTSTSGDSPTSGQSLTLTEVPVFTLSLMQGAPINCNGDSTASVTGTVINGVAPYTYTINGGAPIGPIPLPSVTVPNIGAGTFHVTVIDGAGAVSSDSIVISQPTQIQSTISTTDETCFQLANGTATVSAIGGTTPYTYSWSNGSTTTSAIGLAAGMHFVTITDSNSCTYIDTATILGASQILVTPTISHPSCLGTTNGSITVVASGGVVPYTYLWSTGDTFSNIISLDTGMYSVTVTSANGCQVTASYQLSTTVLPPTISLTAINPTCNTSYDGALTAMVNGGTAPLVMQWNTGDTTLSITNIDTGLYAFVVADATGCLAFDTITVLSDNIVPVVNLGPDTVICSVDVGSFALNAGNLVNNYNYLWNTADTTYALTVYFTGNFWLEVTDTLGCVGSDSIFVGEQICSGIEDLFTIEQISAYPLPANNVLNIDTKTAGLIEIYDVFGKKVISTDVNSGKMQLDVSQLSQGTYVLRFLSENGEGVKKIMIL